MSKSTFTKIHFEEIANVFSENLPMFDHWDTQKERNHIRSQRLQWLRMRQAFIQLFEHENPKFNKQKFIAATENPPIDISQTAKAYNYPIRN